MNSATLNPRRYASLIGLFFLLFLATLVVTPLIGSSSLDLGKAFSRDIPFEDNVDANILFLARLPRIFLGAVTGAALSVAGAVFQALLRNDLAAPFTLGVSSGAALGAVIAISLGLDGSFLGFSFLPLSAFLGALGAIFLVFGLVKSRGREFSTSTLLLAGVTANFFLRGAGDVHSLSGGFYPVVSHHPLADGRAGHHKLSDGVFDFTSGAVGDRRVALSRQKHEPDQRGRRIRRQPGCRGGAHADRLLRDRVFDHGIGGGHQRTHRFRGADRAAHRAPSGRAGSQTFDSGIDVLRRELFDRLRYGGAHGARPHGNTGGHHHRTHRRPVFRVVAQKTTLRLKI